VVEHISAQQDVGLQRTGHDLDYSGRQFTDPDLDLDQERRESRKVTVDSEYREFTELVEL